MPMRVIAPDEAAVSVALLTLIVPCELRVILPLAVLMA